MAILLSCMICTTCCSVSRVSPLTREPDSSSGLWLALFVIITIIAIIIIIIITIINNNNNNNNSNDHNNSLILQLIFSKQPLSVLNLACSRNPSFLRAT